MREGEADGHDFAFHHHSQCLCCVYISDSAIPMSITRCRTDPLCVSGTKATPPRAHPLTILGPESSLPPHFCLTILQPPRSSTQPFDCPRYCTADTRYHRSIVVYTPSEGLTGIIEALLSIHITYANACKLLRQHTTLDCRILFSNPPSCSNTKPHCVNPGALVSKIDCCLGQNQLSLF